MGAADITCAGLTLSAEASGALFWPDEGVLVVGDLHLGRAERLARQGASLLPPYETVDTLNRLDAEIARLSPRTVICLGDSFDDLAAAGALAAEVAPRIERLAAGRRWIWVAGNHDPGPVEMPGSHMAEVAVKALGFRHIAARGLAAGHGEVSAHYHPKARLLRRGLTITRRCFLAGQGRVIMPAFGTYTGGLDAQDPVFDALVGDAGHAYLVGRSVTPVRRDRLG